jgi:hypothetical protein
MPVPGDVVPGIGVQGGDTVLAFYEDPAWTRWAEDEGRLTYARFLLSHPRYLFFEPWPDLLGVRNTSLEPPSVTGVLLSPTLSYGRSHPVIPDTLESLLWGRREAGIVAVGLVALGGLAVLSERRWRPSELVAGLGPARTVAAVGLLVSIGHLLLVWHASANELDRLAMVPATTLHSCLIILLAVTLDRRLSPADPEPSN